MYYKTFISFKINKDNIILSVIQQIDKNYIQVESEKKIEYNNFLNDSLSIIEQNLINLLKKYNKNDKKINLIFSDQIFDYKYKHQINIINDNNVSINDKLVICENEVLLNENVYKYKLYFDDGWTKEYKILPIDKKHSSAEEYKSRLYINTNQNTKNYFIKLKNILNAFKQTKWQNYYFYLENQLLANKLLPYKGNQIMVHVLRDKILLNIVKNGIIYAEKIINNGTDLLFENSKLQNIDKNILDSRLNSILDKKFHQQFINFDEINSILENNISKLYIALDSYIKAFILKLIKNAKKAKIWLHSDNNNLLPYWVVSLKNKNDDFYSNCDFNSLFPYIRNEQFSLISDLDFSFQQAVLASNNNEIDDYSHLQTITSEFNIEKVKNKPFLTVFKSWFSINK
ncbi:hypothetical protein KQ876_01690 [Mycoplasma sp. CSL7491-lung]|uniref:MAG3720 family protein n=1 Tax=Mycoplasma sp. CSL7491-lung TaxID=549718 RepID=UPI001C0F7A8F|nr:hypothetical protein [Mycoplasma sp. CSL7491-lung]MBU4692918.1 hypothetical protein [Mycoplasma sp. CSL7491-lung]